MTTYRLQDWDRLEPQTEWRGGRIMDSDLLTLEEAAREASKHAGVEITPADFLRAAGRGEIAVQAIVRRQAQLKATRPGDSLPNNTRGLPPGTLIARALVPLPQSAARALANTGSASWRALEGYETLPESDPMFPGEKVRFDRWALEDGEPDMETVQADCRVKGYDVHALADAFIDDPEPPRTALSKGTPPKLSEADKAQILTLYNRGRGESVNALAVKFRVSRPVIDRVLQRAGVKVSR